MSAAKKGGGPLSLERPSKRSASKAAALEEGLDRIAVDVPTPLYRAVKVRCAERGVSLKAYLLEMLAKDGIS